MGQSDSEMAEAHLDDNRYTDPFAVLLARLPATGWLFWYANAYGISYWIRLC